MDAQFAAAIFEHGVILEENNNERSGERIWPRTIDGRWLYPGEKVIDYQGNRYVVTMPTLVASKNLE